jgi:hypothetical protein
MVAYAVEAVKCGGGVVPVWSDLSLGRAVQSFQPGRTLLVCAASYRAAVQRDAESADRAEPELPRSRLSAAAAVAGSAIAVIVVLLLGIAALVAFSYALGATLPDSVPPPDGADN